MADFQKARAGAASLLPGRLGAGPSEAASAWSMFDVPVGLGLQRPPVHSLELAKCPEPLLCARSYSMTRQLASWVSQL